MLYIYVYKCWNNFLMNNREPDAVTVCVIPSTPVLFWCRFTHTEKKSIDKLLSLTKLNPHKTTNCWVLHF